MKGRNVIAPAFWLVLVVTLGALVAGGCCNGHDRDAALLARQEQARANLLFGATPPAVGYEHLGYFAALDVQEDGDVPFDLTTVYLRRTVHDYQTTRHPFASGHRTHVYSVEQQLWLQDR